MCRHAFTILINRSVFYQPTGPEPSVSKIPQVVPHHYNMQTQKQ